MDCKDMILSDDFYEVLMDYSVSVAEPTLVDIRHCFLNLEGDYHILYVDSAQAQPLSISGYRYAYIPKCYAVLTEEELTGDFTYLGGAYEESGISDVQNPPLSLTGAGMLIGFVDTGVRYWLDEFIRQDGSSKILSVWDQTQQEGPPPPGMIYGTEYTQEMLESAAAERREEGTSALPHEDASGHGTRVASVALRAAPDAQIVMVKCRQAKPYLKAFYGIPREAQAYAESDIMAGLSYLEQVARQRNMPLVICVTMGTNMGDHRGSSLLNRYLELLGTRKRRSVVIGGGNEGNRAHHYEGNLEMTDDVVYEDVEIRVSENVPSFSLELWGEIPYGYSVSLQSPDGERAERIPIRYGSERTVQFLYSRTTVLVSYIFVERNSGSQLVFLRFTDPSPGIWTVRVFVEGIGGTATYQMWLPMEEFLRQPVYFLRPDPYLTMTEPAYNEIAIGHTYYDSNSGGFAIDSGRGARQFAPLQPALSVAGVNVATVQGDVTGSSVSAALMAGAAAQFMEWAITGQGDELISSISVRNYFIRGALRVEGEEYPSATWGYGKMNIERLFEAISSQIS